MWCLSGLKLVVFFFTTCVTFISGTISPKSRPWIRVFDVSNRITPYNIGLQWQRRLMQEQIDQQDDTTNNGMCGSVLLLQHSHVYTLGSATDPSTSGPFSLSKGDNTEELPFDIVNVDRGGQATYHGPGQLVVYPILDLVRPILAVLLSSRLTMTSLSFRITSERTFTYTYGDWNTWSWSCYGHTVLNRI